MWLNSEKRLFRKTYCLHSLTFDRSVCKRFFPTAAQWKRQKMWPVLVKNWHLNCKGVQTNMPQNVGSIEDPISKNIRSRHLEFCKAGRATWKLTLQDISTTPKEPKTLRGWGRRQLFRHSAWRQWGRSNLSKVKNILTANFKAYGANS